MYASTAYWRTRAQTYGAEHPDAASWTAHYWASWKMPHRLDLLKSLEEIEPAHSMFEIGCNVGPNLRLWRQRWPERMLMGCDVSQEAVSAGQAYFAHDSWVHLWRDDVFTTPWLPMADLIVTCYVLAYTPPALLDEVLEKIWRSARVAVVVAEPQVIAASDQDSDVIEREPPTYRYDYTRRLRALGAQTTGRAIEAPDFLNGILIARRPA